MKSNQKPSKSYEFFIKSDTSQYAGEWIAIVEDKIVAHGKDAEKVYKQALKKATAQSIALAKAPEKQLMVLTLSPYDCF